MSSAGPGIAPRSCIYFRNTLCALPLSELCSTDVVAVRVDFHLRTEKEGSYFYLSIPLLNSDEPPLSKGLREVTDYVSSNEMQLTIGWNANVHHII